MIQTSSFAIPMQYFNIIIPVLTINNIKGKLNSISNVAIVQLRKQRSKRVI